MRNYISDKDIYNANCEAPVNSMIVCPECHSRFIKKTYNHKFCCSKCKDDYHNHINPERAVRQANFWKRVKEENLNITDKYKYYG